MRLLLCVGLLGSTVALGERYEVEPFAKVRFLVEGPLDDVEGLTRSVNGELRLDPTKWTEGSGSLAVDLRSLRTGIDKRDDDMRDHFLETARFPRALLEISRIEGGSSPSLTAGKLEEGQATGSFELHGYRRAVRFKVFFKQEKDGRLQAMGGFPVVLADYGIQRPERLFLKLGSVAQVQFEAAFRRVETPAPPPSSPQAVALRPSVPDVLPTLPPPPRAPRRPKAPLRLAFLFPEDSKSAMARGERLFQSAAIGGEGNTLSCADCHAKTDERKGSVQSDGHARSAHSLFGAAHRPRFWNGFADTLPKAIQLCAKLNLRSPQGLAAAATDDLVAFVGALSSDPAPELDYRVLYRTFESPLRAPTEGDVDRGRSLAFRHCMTCHLSGRAAPLLLPGLYEADWVVRRIRRLEGHQNRQEPPFSIDRLPDSELRDIVTWLASPKSALPVFPRENTKSGGGS